LGLRGRANSRRLAARSLRLEKVYALSIFTWSLFTVLQGFVGEFGMSTAMVALFMLRFLVGLAEAPSFPGNARIVAAWFPTAERGTASAIFNSAQYFATVLFAPLMGWIVYASAGSTCSS
jgi:ACS family glucarate transporter-like MFS transporter